MRRFCCRVRPFIVVFTLFACATFAASRASAHPVVAGFERFHVDGQDARAAEGFAGRLLLGELNCTSCHSVDDAEALEDGCRASPTSPSHGAGYLLLALAALFGGLRRWGRATARPPLRSRTSSSLGDAPGP